MAKTRRKRLKQFAILYASAKIAYSPEIHNLTHKPMVCGSAIVCLQKIKRSKNPELNNL
jgi:hypothetical protein